ncbi:hypothetical protein KY362_01615 [Candidatus Woesearchaeota archaeon]|nr:hypothetical protein [Candidatus Woesearchaeota archaeon]
MIKRFDVESYLDRSALMGLVAYPYKFYAVIDGTEPMRELISIAERGLIIGDERLRSKRGLDYLYAAVWSAFSVDSEIPYDNYVIDEKLGLASFVMQEKKYRGEGTSILEGVYAISKQEHILVGRLLDDDYNASLHDIRFGSKFRHFSYHVDSIEGGVLKGRKVQGRQPTTLFSYDLTRLLVQENMRRIMDG